MAIGIRLADNHVDVHEIAQLLDAVWPEEHHRTENILAAINAVSHQTWIALDYQGSNYAMVGLADTFMTVTSTGSKRWELDLLAVHPDYQAGLIRALVRVNNTACHRTLKSMKFLPTGDINTLFVCDVVTPGLTIRLPLGSELIPVRTCNYHGFWLETTADVSQAMSAAVGLPSHDGSPLDKEWKVQEKDVVGILVHEESHPDPSIQSYQMVGRYQWWSRQLSN
jgi:hypothetical protein